MLLYLNMKTMVLHVGYTKQMYGLGKVYWVVVEKKSEC